MTGKPYSTCPCGSPEYLNSTPPLREDGKSILCQMNKFDDLMAFLAAGDDDFTQVVAVDRSFKLFTRAWCVAELAEANKMGMRQQLKLVSQQSLDQQQDQLRDLDVEKMQAARLEDVQEILSKIPDVVAFNAHLQSLLFGHAGLFAMWAKFDIVEQAAQVGRIAALVKAQEKFASESEQIVPNSGASDANIKACDEDPDVFAV